MPKMSHSYSLSSWSVFACHGGKSHRSQVAHSSSDLVWLITGHTKILHTISCVLKLSTIQLLDMSQTAFPTKWKFVVEFQDDETLEISGDIGQADTEEECEGLIEYDMEYHRSAGRTILNAEASEVCANCEGEGRIHTEDGALLICHSCRGQSGPVSQLSYLERQEEPDGIFTLPSGRLIEEAAAMF